MSLDNIALVFLGQPHDGTVLADEIKTNGLAGGVSFKDAGVFRDLVLVIKAAAPDNTAANRALKILAAYEDSNEDEINALLIYVTKMIAGKGLADLTDTEMTFLEHLFELQFGENFGSSNLPNDDDGLPKADGDEIITEPKIITESTPPLSRWQKHRGAVWTYGIAVLIIAVFALMVNKCAEGTGGPLF